MKNLSKLILMALCILHFHAHASEKIPTKKIEVVLKTYAKNIGCLQWFDSNNIVKLEDKFIALYAIDYGCSGGTHMSEPAFLVLKYSYKNTIIVVPELSSPVAQLIGFPQHLNKIYLKDNKLWYSAKEYNWSIQGFDVSTKGDASCCPSVEINAKFFLEKEGHQIEKHAELIQQKLGASRFLTSWYWIDPVAIKLENALPKDSSADH